MDIVIIYLALYLFALYADSLEKEWQKHFLLVATCLVLVYLIGIRDTERWPDTPVYVMSFLDFTPPFSELTSDDGPFGYTEMGFYYIGVFVKTFTSNVTIYLMFVGLLSFLFLYKSFQTYCMYPLLGVCAYVSRFYVARNFIQIRAGLSYAIVLVAVQYITNRDWKRYFGLIFIAYQFHQSALIAVPLYFLCLFDLKKKHIVIGVGIAFVIALFFSNTVRALVADNASDLEVSSYVSVEYQRKWGLSNPMIYFQVFLLMFYTFAEKRIQESNPHYITIRNAYFYSTLILITLSCYTALSGRTSSMFSTLEMAIIPSLAYAFSEKDRKFAFIVMGMALTTIFFLNNHIY